MTPRGPLGYVVLDLPINYSFGHLHITVYLALMLQASWHTADGN